MIIGSSCDNYNNYSYNSYNIYSYNNENGMADNYIRWLRKFEML